MGRQWKIKHITQAIAVAFITVVAAVGLIQAPSKSSDHLAEDLQKELEVNKEILQGQKDNEPAVKVTLIGDSVMLGAVPDLMEQIPESKIDAKESRQVAESVDVLKELAKEDLLGDTVVIELGINSYFTPATGQELIDYLGPDREIYWLTVYGRYLQDQERINQVIRGLAESNKNLHIIAWDEVAVSHMDWFYNDGIHLNGAGRLGFATLLRESLGLEPPKEAEPSEEPTAQPIGEMIVYCR